MKNKSALRNLFPKTPELRGLWRNKVTEIDLGIIFPGIRNVKVLSNKIWKPQRNEYHFQTQRLLGRPVAINAINANKNLKKEGELLERCK